jgi:hypothetical protein
MVATTRGRRARRAAAGLGATALLGLSGCWVDEGTPPDMTTAFGVGVTADGTIAVYAAAGRSIHPQQAYVLEPDGDWVVVPGGLEVRPVAIADDGTMVAGIQGPVLIGSVDTPFHPLSDDSGVAHNDAADIGDTGVVVGNDSNFTTGRLQAWLWQPAGHRDVLLQGLGATDETRVAAVNDDAVAVGWSGERTDDPSSMVPVAWAPPSYRPTALSLPVGATYAGASDIGDGGDVVGAATVGGVSRAVVWDGVGGPARLLDERTDPATSSTAQYVDDDGTVVGRLDGRPTLWDAATSAPVALQVPRGTYGDIIFGIDNGHVVGTIAAPEGGGLYHVFRYGVPAD